MVNSVVILPAFNVSGEMIPAGLTTAGLLTPVALDAISWTALPPLALIDRNAISIQNVSGVEIKINYDNAEPGYVGTVIDSGSERFYNITDAIQIYAKASAGTPTIMIEEIS